MPYVDQKARERLDAGGTPETKGELNYCATMMLVRYLQGVEARGGKLGYGTVSEGIDALHDAECEARRRLLDPYEDSCIERNGDCYPAAMLKTLHAERVDVEEVIGSAIAKHPVIIEIKETRCGVVGEKTTRIESQPPMQHQPKEEGWLHTGGVPPVAEHKKEA